MKRKKKRREIKGVEKRKSGRWIRNAFVCLLTVILAVGLFGCGEGTEDRAGGSKSDQSKTAVKGFPVTIRDDLGAEITFEKAPERIVSLSPANTEILFALGLSAKVVGRTDYCNDPEEAKQVLSVGDFNAPNLEKIVSLAPELVMATDFIDEEVRAQLENGGVKVVVYRAAGIDEVLADIQKTGQITGTSEKAQELTDQMSAKRQEIMEKAGAAPKRISVFVDIGDFYSAGKGSLLDSMLQDLKVDNIAGEIEDPWPLLSKETIISANPDVYLSLYTTPEEIRKIAGFDTMNAVKNDRIVFYEMLSAESDLIQRPGPRIVEGLERLAKDLLPDQF